MWRVSAPGYSAEILGDRRSKGRFGVFASQVAVECRAELIQVGIGHKKSHFYYSFQVGRVGVPHLVGQLDRSAHVPSQIMWRESDSEVHLFECLRPVAKPAGDRR